MASVLCIQQKMSRARSHARRRAQFRRYPPAIGYYNGRTWIVGYQEVKRWRVASLELTALEAR